MVTDQSNGFATNSTKEANFATKNGVNNIYKTPLYTWKKLPALLYVLILR